MKKKQFACCRRCLPDHITCCSHVTCHESENLMVHELMNPKNIILVDFLCLLVLHFVQWYHSINLLISFKILHAAYCINATKGSWIAHVLTWSYISYMTFSRLSGFGKTSARLHFAVFLKCMAEEHANIPTRLPCFSGV